MRAPKPRLYLVTPPDFDADRHGGALADAIDAGDVACVRLWLPAGHAAAHRAGAAALKALCHNRPEPIAALATDAFQLAAEMGLDGVHLTAGGDLKGARAALGDDGVIGVEAGTSRHAGLVAGERGADYVVFGPVAADPALHSGDLADAELFDWWQCMIELPVVAEGGLTPESAGALTGLADFVALGPELWAAEDPAAAVAAFQAAIDAADADRGPSA